MRHDFEIAGVYGRGDSGFQRESYAGGRGVFKGRSCGTGIGSFWSLYG